MILAANGRAPPPLLGLGLLESLSQKTRAPCRGGGEAGGAGSATDPTSPYPGWASRKPRPGVAPVRLERKPPVAAAPPWGPERDGRGCRRGRGGEEAWAALATIPGRYLPGKETQHSDGAHDDHPFLGVRLGYSYSIGQVSRAREPGATTLELERERRTDRMYREPRIGEGG